MKNFLLILFSAAVLLTCSEKKKDQRKIDLKADLNLIENMFTIKDSVLLEYPEEAFPSFVYDLSLNNNYIYMCGENRKFPIVKFDKNGMFIKYIGKIGNGPGEYPTIPNKISVNKKILAVMSSNLQGMYIFKDDVFSNQMNFTAQIDGAHAEDIQVLDNKNILIVNKGKSKYQMVLLNEELDIINNFNTMPISSSIMSLMSQKFWAVQMVKNNIITHISYPPNIYEYSNVDDKISLKKEINLKLKKYQKIDPSITYESLLNTRNITPQELYESYSEIFWVIKKDSYYIGSYFYFDKANKSRGYTIPILRLFIYHNNKVINEQDVSRAIGILIPVNNQLVSCSFYKKNGNLNLKLYFLDFICKNF